MNAAKDMYEIKNNINKLEYAARSLDEELGRIPRKFKTEHKKKEKELRKVYDSLEALKKKLMRQEGKASIESDTVYKEIKPILN